VLARTPHRRFAPALLATLALLVLGAAASGCGEKSEPDLGELASTEELPLGDQLRQLGDQDITTAGPIQGRWRGTLTQKGVKPFPIDVRIDSLADPKRNPVTYGGQIGCSGTWRYIGGEGAVVRFQETIDSGRGGDCKGEGTVTLRYASSSTDALLYEFRAPGGVESKGTIRLVR
jgi:hypothetical protein